MAKRVWSPEEWWYSLLTDNNPPLPGRQLRHLLRMLPSGPRCKFCNAPYHGVGGSVMHLIGKGPSRLTPQLCRQCEGLAQQFLGGAEIELTLLFADVRGSTALAEHMSPAAYSKLISRFFAVAGEVLIRHQAMVDKLIGDQASGMFVPGFVGPAHRDAALDAARELMHATGHSSGSEPWVPLGIGIHTGVAFVGSVGAQGGAHDVTVLGDPANVAARLSSAAASGEILLTPEAAGQALNAQALEQRKLDLKGKSQPVSVYVVNA